MNKIKELKKMVKTFSVKRREEYDLVVNVELHEDGILISDDFAEHMFYFYNEEFEQIIKEYNEYKQKKAS